MSQTETQPAKVQCAFHRKNNTRCRARALFGTEYCLWHQPDAESASTSSAVPLLPATVELETAEDVFQLMKTAALHLATAENPDISRLHTLNAVAGTLLRFATVKELEANVTELKKEVESARRFSRELERERNHAREWGEEVAEERNSMREDLAKCRNKLRSLGIDPESLEDT